MTQDDLPPEVQDLILWDRDVAALGGPLVRVRKPDFFHIREKTQCSRFQAWLECPHRKSGGWRKCHTKSYWVWYDHEADRASQQKLPLIPTGGHWEQKTETDVGFESRWEE